MRWQEKVRKDYKDILSDEQIESTIDYWSDIIEDEIDRRLDIYKYGFDYKIKDLV